MGYVCSLLMVIESMVEHSARKVINVVLSLFMGTDMDAIMTNPIGQPMATVRAHITICVPGIPPELLSRTCFAADHLQQPGAERYSGCLVNSCNCTVSTCVIWRECPHPLMIPTYVQVSHGL